MFKITEELIRRKFKTTQEVCELLKMSGVRVRRLCSEGRFTGAFNFGGAWLIPSESVNGFERLSRGRKKREKMI